MALTPEDPDKQDFEDQLLGGFGQPLLAMLIGFAIMWALIRWM